MDKSVSEGMLQPFILWALVSAALAADFQYRDFNDTTGLSFNGNASTSNCGDGTPYVYSSIHNINEANSILHEAEQYSIETSTRYSVTNRSTVVFGEGETISSYFALGGHRDVSVIASRSNCPVRIRYALASCIIARMSSCTNKQTLQIDGVKTTTSEYGLSR